MSFSFTEKNPENPPKAVAVYAGLEPLDFTNLFPYWDVEETARSLNLRVGTPSLHPCQGSSYGT